jgi:SAM-dependent methyltransferase
MKDGFPLDLLLPAGVDRRKMLVQKYYEHHHSSKRDISSAKGEKQKLEFYTHCLERHGIYVDLGIDLGCRGGAITQGLLPYGNWVGVDIDRNAIEMANARGIPCIESDISIALDFRDESFNAVCMTEVLEHLPYPSITLSEIWRILRKDASAVFLGSVPLDYHLHRRYQVFRGKRLSKDPTHLRSFSCGEIKYLLNHYFDHVIFVPLSGMKVRYPWLGWNHFVSDIAWFAQGPKKDPGGLE